MDGHADHFSAMPCADTSRESSGRWSPKSDGYSVLTSSWKWAGGWGKCGWKVRLEEGAAV
ncbi:MAG: hypothetical protein ACRD9R_07220 [Pyrinomonadaceae bacterium]